MTEAPFYNLNLVNLPDIALEKILSYLSYDELSSKRAVCMTLNATCGSLLNKGFMQLERRHAALYKVVKSFLPRRPSERRSHLVVSRYCELLQGIETRIRMLDVTYMRYINQHLVCFIPGKVLDEIGRLLSLIENKFDPPGNNNQLLEELRDLSSMAMEHFDEHILPNIEKHEKALLFKNVASVSKMPPSPGLANEIQKVKQKNRIQRHNIVYLVDKVQKINRKLWGQNIRLKKQAATIRQQNLKIQVQTSKIENHEMMILDMKKRIEEIQQNHVELKKKIDSVENLRNMHSLSSSSLYKSNIKPRHSRILPRNYVHLLQRAELKTKLGNIENITSQPNFENALSYKSNIRPRASKLWQKDYSTLLNSDLKTKNVAGAILPVSTSWLKNILLGKINLKYMSKSPTKETSSTILNNCDKDISNYKSVTQPRKPTNLPKNLLTQLDLERKRKLLDWDDIPNKISRPELNILKDGLKGDAKSPESKNHDKDLAENIVEEVTTIQGDLLLKHDYLIDRKRKALENLDFPDDCVKKSLKQ